MKIKYDVPGMWQKLINISYDYQSADIPRSVQILIDYILDPTCLLASGWTEQRVRFRPCLKDS